MAHRIATGAENRTLVGLQEEMSWLDLVRENFP